MTASRTRILTRFFAQLSKRVQLLVCLVAGVPLYLLYISGLTENPPGFYVDESCVSYNALTIYLRGQGEFGNPWPLYFPIFPLGPSNYLGYSDPVQIYTLAALYNIFPPSIFLSRALSATAMFLMAILLGILARRISGRTFIGVILALLAMMTPWLFEIGRLAFSAPLYPLTVVLLLLAVYNAYRKEQWFLLNNVLIALALALTTYTYAIGRLLGPLLAFGLILFATDLKRLKYVVKTWAAYGITLIPMLVFHLRNPDALAGRFRMSVSYVTPDMGFFDAVTEFVKHYFENISLWRLLVTGDPILRHHVADSPAMLAVTVLLALAGIVNIGAKQRKDPWWRYILFGLVVSVVPASLGIEEFHFLRLSAFPVFALVLMVPALMWLLGDPRERVGSRLKWLEYLLTKPTRSIVLAVLLLAAVAQAMTFQIYFWEVGPNRGAFFDSNFPTVFATALEQSDRPIYFVDQTYYHAFWQSAVQGVDQSNFVRLPPRERPPANSLILSEENGCSECELIQRDAPYVLYRTFVVPVEPEVFVSNLGADPGQFYRPQGIAADRKGNYFVADTENGRVEKFDPTGAFLSSFSTGNEGETTNPFGIAVDKAGNIFVTDLLNQNLKKFTSNGEFLKAWLGPDRGFYGPRDVAAGPNDQLYIVDQGRSRVVRFDPESEISWVWGEHGTGDGQFDDPSGIHVSGRFVFVTDTGNGRVQVFDLQGNYISQWAVPQWENDVSHHPDAAFDEETKRVYVSSGKSNQVFVFNIDGTYSETLEPEKAFNNPSALVISKTASGKTLYVVNTGSNIELTGSPSVSIIELSRNATKAKPGK